MEATSPDPRSIRPTTAAGKLAVALTYIALYELAAIWGRDIQVMPGITPWFPAVGLTLGLLVGFGPRYWPVAFLAELISGTLVYDIDSTFTTAQVLLNTAVITGSYLLAAIVLRDWLRIDTSLRDFRSLFWLLVVGVIVAPLITAFGGVAMRVWAGSDSASNYFDEVRTWWVGDAIGIVSVTPVVLTVGAAVINRRRPNLGPVVRRGEALAQAGLVLFLPYALYALQGDTHRLLFLSFLPVIWVAVTRGFLVTSIAVLYTNAASTAAAYWQGAGALDLTDVQTFMLTLGIMSLGVAAAMRELRRSRAALAFRAAHDELTRLPNRGEFFKRLSRALAAGDEVAVIFFDVDRLRIVGDSLGLEVMDRLLGQIGARVKYAVGNQCLVSRYGGDEFAVMISGANAGERGSAAAQHIAAVLKQPFQLKQNEVYAPASVGVAIARPGDDAGSVLRRADLARADAKRRGADDAVTFDEELGIRVQQRHTLERDLRVALERSEMSVVFQPIFAVPGREVIYVESLARWKHPERGPVSPADFIPIAEDTGVIRDIGRFVLEVACQRAAGWPSTSIDGPPIVSVNVSVCQLGEEGLIRDLENALARSGLPPGRLALEITESMALEDPEATVAYLHRLRGLGVELWIDDFGAGYSSLGHLHRLPVSVVKVDRMFTEQLGYGSPGETVVSSVIQLASGMGLRVVAEGVENDEQLSHLTRLGVDAVQGYGLSRPLPADGLASVLSTRTPVRPLHESV
jgi:diguanylate cyclase (GGDEF)-like protein